MSTIFKLLGSNSSTDEEVNRIVDIEKEFKNVWIILFINSMTKHAISKAPPPPNLSKRYTRRAKTKKWSGKSTENLVEKSRRFS